MFLPDFDRKTLLCSLKIQVEFPSSVLYYLPLQTNKLTTFLTTRGLLSSECITREQYNTYWHSECRTFSPNKWDFLIPLNPRVDYGALYYILSRMEMNQSAHLKLKDNSFDIDYSDILPSGATFPRIRCQHNNRSMCRGNCASLCSNCDRAINYMRVQIAKLCDPDPLSNVWIFQSIHIADSMVHCSQLLSTDAFHHTLGEMVKWIPELIKTSISAIDVLVQTKQKEVLLTLAAFYNSTPDEPTLGNNMLQSVIDYAPEDLELFRDVLMKMFLARLEEEKFVLGAADDVTNAAQGKLLACVFRECFRSANRIPLLNTLYSVVGCVGWKQRSLIHEQPHKYETLASIDCTTELFEACVQFILPKHKRTCDKMFYLSVFFASEEAFRAKLKQVDDTIVRRGDGSIMDDVLKMCINLFFHGYSFYLRKVLRHFEKIGTVVYPKNLNAELGSLDSDVVIDYLKVVKIDPEWITDDVALIQECYRHSLGTEKRHSVIDKLLPHCTLSACMDAYREEGDGFMEMMCHLAPEMARRVERYGSTSGEESGEESREESSSSDK